MHFRCQGSAATICLIVMAIILCLTVFSTIGEGTDNENCPDGWHYYQQRHKCFLLDDTPLIWDQARNRCKEHGGRLTTIPDAQTNEFLIGLIYPSCMQYWIGLHDRSTEAVFQWGDGHLRSNFTYWAPGEPNSLGDEDCVCISANRNSRWNDAFCGTYLGYSCERPARNTHSPTMTEPVTQTRTTFPVIDTDTAPSVEHTSTRPPVIDTSTAPPVVSSNAMTANAKPLSEKITCSSIHFRPARCSASSPITAITKVKKVSRAACVKNRSYGLAEDGQLWVKKGCRAIFTVHIN